MFVIKKLRLNKFVARPLVSNRSLFVAMGPKSATIESKDSSDCYDAPTVEGATKTKVLGLAMSIANKAMENRENNGEVRPLVANAKDM